MKRLAVAGISVVALVAATGCVEPGLVDTDETDEVAAPEIVEAPPLDLGPLRDEVRALIDNLTALDVTLQQAEDSQSLAGAREAGEQALKLLLTSDDDSGQALLPHETTDRAITPDDPALLITSLGAAGDVGGRAGAALREVIADGIAGDLGGWQRDAAGMVAWARDVADPKLPLESLQATILELPGDGLRALAWTFLLAEASDVATAIDYAERARTHISLMLDRLTAIDVSGEPDVLGENDLSGANDEELESP